MKYQRNLNIKWKKVKEKHHFSIKRINKQYKKRITTTKQGYTLKTYLKRYKT